MTPSSPEHVLSTLEHDGSRRWLKPRVSKGRFLNRRRAFAYFLMALFFILPFVRGTFPYLALSGKPLFLLDIIHRKFTIFGYTFLPTDTFLLALGLLFLFVSIFLFTAIFGRLWCGWACPQTVYMEFLYRPLERLFEATIGRGGAAKKKSFPRKVGYFFAALFITAIPAHTFLAYFVGVENLFQWMRSSPFEHPTAFLVMAVTTALMFFDFYYFREQLCLIACPYGRFQSVLLDRFSLIVSYDKNRGEPRGKRISLPISKSEKSPPADHLPLATDHSQGDCVDCGMCVTTCPTGIDIRDGLQLECVNCTQCIDACDAVMEKIHRPRGLIRYSSQAAMEAGATGLTDPEGPFPSKETSTQSRLSSTEPPSDPCFANPALDPKDHAKPPRKLRSRVIFYPAMLILLAIAWLFVFSTRSSADITILRNAGSPYTLLAQGAGAGTKVANMLKLKITNRTDQSAQYHFELIDFPEARLDASENPVTVAAGASQTVGFVVEAPPAAFLMGKREVFLRVTSANGYTGKVLVRLLGPMSTSDAEPGGTTSPHPP